MRWVFLLVALSLFSTEKIGLKREDGSEIIAYCDRPEKSSYPIVLFIAGSQKQSSLGLHEALRGKLLESGLCPITLEKRGIEGEKCDEKQFNLYLCFEERLKDHFHLYENLKTLIPNWNGKLAILGQGDGGRIGAHFATQINSVEGIALIASGGGWDPLNEILYSFREEMAEDGYSPQYIQGFLVQARQEFEQATSKPSADRKAFGYTYKYWESFLKTHLAQDLSKLKCPIYSINGDADDRVPIASVAQLKKLIEDRMVLSRKEKAGREILQNPKIYEEAVSWLSERL